MGSGDMLEVQKQGPLELKRKKGKETPLEEEEGKRGKCVGCAQGETENPEETRGWGKAQGCFTERAVLGFPS